MSIIAIILLVLVVIAGVWAVVTYNGFIKKQQAVLASQSGITVELKRRLELIPALVKTVKAAAAFESGTLERVIEARNMASAVKDAPLADRAEAENMLTGALKSLFALAEAYPTLTATANYRDLQSQLTETEDRIAAGRRIYNSNCQSFNTSIAVAPASVIAGAFSSKFPPFDYFEDTTPGIESMPEIDL